MFVVMLFVGFFPTMKVILMGHCLLFAKSPLSFPLPVKPAHSHKHDDMRGSLSTAKSCRMALLGQKWDDITDGFHCGSCTGTCVDQAADKWCTPFRAGWVGAAAQQWQLWQREEGGGLFFTCAGAPRFVSHLTQPFCLLVVLHLLSSPPPAASSQRVHVTAAFSAQWGSGNDVVSSELIFSVSVNQAPTVIPVNYFKCKCHIETNVWMRRWMSTLEERYFQYTVVVPFVINIYF